MKPAKLIIFLVLSFTLSITSFGQNDSGFGKLHGCWMESGEAGLSYESIFVFNTSTEGTINGTAYFYNSEDEAFEYSISSIKLSGDTLVFVIDETSIYFEGLLNTGYDGISGNLVLEDNTKLNVSHRKVDPETVRRLSPKGNLYNEKIIKKQIDAGAGLEIGAIKPDKVEC